MNGTAGEIDDNVSKGRAWMLGHVEDDGGFVLEPMFVVVRPAEGVLVWCARRTLEEHGMCGQPRLTAIAGEPIPVSGDRDVVITCRDCGRLLAEQSRAREVDAEVGSVASRYFWDVQRARIDAGLPEQAVTA